jgi:CCR4-NOT transcription complex subunit 4
MSDDGDHTCPLCAEEMDITDQQLKPCKCGYDVCISIILLSDQSTVCLGCCLCSSHNNYELKHLTAIYSIFLVYVPTLQICVWCWHHIIDMAEKEETEGRCPACRTPYDKDRIVKMAATCNRFVRNFQQPCFLSPS